MIESFEIWIIIGILLFLADLVIILRLINGRGEKDKSLIFAEHQKDELLNRAAGNPSPVDEPMEIANYCQVSQSVRYPDPGQKDPLNRHQKSPGPDRSKQRHRGLHAGANPLSAPRTG